MFISKHATNPAVLLAFVLLAGCASSARTVQDKEFNASLIELMEDMSTRLSEEPVSREERLILRYSNKSSEIQLELDPKQDDFYLDLSGVSLVSKDTVFREEPLRTQTPASGEVRQNADQSERTAQDVPANGDQIRQVLSKFRRAQDLFYLQEYSEALELLNQTLDIAETADAYALKGTIHFMLGNRNATRDNWGRAVELNPDLPLPNIPELEDLIEAIKAGK